MALEFLPKPAFVRPLVKLLRRLLSPTPVKDWFRVPNDDGPALSVLSDTGNGITMVDAEVSAFPTLRFLASDDFDSRAFSPDGKDGGNDRLLEPNSDKSSMSRGLMIDDRDVPSWDVVSEMSGMRIEGGRVRRPSSCEQDFRLPQGGGGGGGIEDEVNRLGGVKVIVVMVRFREIMLVAL